MFPSDLRKPRGGSSHPGGSVTPLWPAGWSKMFPAAGGTQGSEAGAAAPTPAPACQACLCPLAALSPLNESVTPMPSPRMFHQGTRPPQGSQPSIPAKLLTKHCPGVPSSPGWLAVLPSPPRFRQVPRCVQGHPGTEGPGRRLRCSLQSPPSSPMTHWSPYQQTPQTGTATAPCRPRSKPDSRESPSPRGKKDGHHLCGFRSSLLG